MVVRSVEILALAKENFCSIELEIRKSMDLEIFYLEYSREKLIRSFEFLKKC